MNERVQLLCESAKDGDADAASELVELFYKRIFAYLRRLTGNEDEAADLTQKTFFKAWVSLGSYQGRSRFSTWLHGIAHHVYADWRRKWSAGELQTDEWWETRASEIGDPCEDAAERDLSGRVYALVDRLEEGIRDVVHLHYYQGLSISETAEALRIATSTVKYRLRKAMEVLRARMEPPAATAAWNKERALL